MTVHVVSVVCMYILCVLYSHLGIYCLQTVAGYFAVWFECLLYNYNCVHDPWYHLVFCDYN